MQTKNPERVGAGNQFRRCHYTSQRLQSPPYSKSLTAFSPLNNELVLFFGDDENNWLYAKSKASRHEPFLLLPDESPERYFWPVRGWDVLGKQYGDFSMDKIPLLAQTLLGFGANVVRVLYRTDKGTGFVVYRNEVAHG